MGKKKKGHKKDRAHKKHRADRNDARTAKDARPSPPAPHDGAPLAPRVVERSTATAAASVTAEEPEPRRHAMTRLVPRPSRVGLVGCVKSKLDHPAPAAELYTSALFSGRRAAVERRCDAWFVLSAKHGLVAPHEVIEPYDVEMSTLRAPARRAWARGVVHSLTELLGDLHGVAFEVHSGASYREHGLAEGITRLGGTVEAPTASMRLGEQLAYYRSMADPDVARGRLGEGPVPSDTGLAELLAARGTDVVTLSFAEVEDALGRLLAPSARRHRAYWSNSSGSSRLWRDAGWKALGVRMDEESVTFVRDGGVDAPRRTALFAHVAPVAPRPEEPGDAPGEAPDVATAVDPDVVRGVVAALLDFAVLDTTRPAGVRPRYTKDPEANDFLFETPFAFLVGVLFDQGIPAERAWGAPFALRARLGHLDPARLAGDEPAIAEAVQRPPMLHRFKETVPAWVAGASRRVLEDYGGDAARIWGDAPSAVELQRRLREFDGIGQKKAAMAVELLERDFGVEVTELAGSDVAFDVHVRRVFLRAGLAARDDLDEIVGSARGLHAQRPGRLDHPAWVIGKKWCRPTAPRCEECPIGTKCPRLVSRASAVRGV